MSYLGLVPSEHSSGPKIKRGPITKTGNGHVRRVLTEAAWAYRMPARVSRALLKRQEDLPESVCDIRGRPNSGFVPATATCGIREKPNRLL
jgi:transposase